MKWYYDLKISVKLIIGFIIVAIIAGAVGMTGIVNLKDIEVKDTEMYKLNTIPLNDISDVGISYQKNRVLLRELTIESDDSKKKQDLQQISENDRLIEEHLALFEKTIRTASGKSEVQRLKNLIAQYAPEREKIINFAQAGQNDKAVEAMRGDASILAADIENSINKLQDLKVDLAKEKAVSNTAAANRAILLMSVFIGLGMLLALILGIFIARIISKPVNELVKVATQIAGGDLNVQVGVKTADEIGVLGRAFGTMADNINDTMRNINSAAEQVSTGSQQVSLTSQNLSQGSTEQASSLEEITSSITEVAAQTKQNATNANQASQLAMAAKDSAIEGNQQMKAMLQAMAEINDSSANISKIIKVIDEIAFQTNILALNAAVEAARAGQHGKGFAVVAEEVRNLAARSANAAKETTDMIEGSIKKVEAGTVIANDTAEALNKIVASVSGATNLVAEIAAASNQQAAAVTQINQGIEQISQVTQSNTATAEESAAASEELSSQAQLLKNMVARFKIKKNIQNATPLHNLSPEILKALEEMAAQKGSPDGANRDGGPEPGPAVRKSQIKIKLDDSDFGKY